MSINISRHRYKIDEFLADVMGCFTVARGTFPSPASLLLWPSRYYLALLKPGWPEILQALASCHLMSLGFSFWSSICAIEGGIFIEIITS